MEYSENIGVRCGNADSADARRTLWFYLPIQIASTHYEGVRLLPEGELPPELDLEYWSFPIGHMLLRKVLSIEGTVRTDVRRNYFSLTIADAEDWRTILPEVVAAIRLYLLQPKLPVSLNPAGQGVEDWHAGLLQELTTAGAI